MDKGGRGVPRPHMGQRLHTEKIYEKNVRIYRAFAGQTIDSR